MGNEGKLKLISITFDQVIRETDLAWLLGFGDKEVWVPKSVSDDPKQDLDETSEVFLQEWFISQEDLEDYET